jgi:hypothetical protein
MKRNTKIVYEYKTEVYPDGNRITGWQQWNLNIYPNKANCEKNHPPNAEMRSNLFNGDEIPRFILNADGSITDSPLPENEKIKLNKVKITRFEKDYPIELQLDILMLGIENKNDPVYREFDRRKKEIKTLKELKQYASY